MTTGSNRTSVHRRAAVGGTFRWTAPSGRQYTTEPTRFPKCDGRGMSTIWEYDARTLASGLSAHLACGAGTGAAFWPFTRIW